MQYLYRYFQESVFCYEMLHIFQRLPTIWGIHVRCKLRMRDLLKNGKNILHFSIPEGIVLYGVCVSGCVCECVSCVCLCQWVRERCVRKTVGLHCSHKASSAQSKRTVGHQWY